MSKIKRKIIFLFVFIMIALIIGCASAPPLPIDLEISPPSADIPSELAAFSGAWEGRLSSGYDIAIVIEEIHEQAADLIYSIGGKKPAYSRLNARVLSGNVLEWTNTDKKSDTCTISRMNIMRNKDLDILILFMIIDCPSHQLSLRADLVRKELERETFLGRTKYPPLPEIDIITPSSEMPLDIAAFSGIWEGRINFGYGKNLLIVEKINSESADIIVSMKNSYTGDIGYQYMNAEVLPGPSIKATYTGGSEMIFSMDEGFNSLSVETIAKPAGTVFTGKLHRLKSLPFRDVAKPQKVNSPLPDDLMVSPPALDIPSEIAALSGRWEGKWGGFVDGIFVVERIDKESGDIIISWGETDGIESGYLRATVKVLPGPSLAYEDSISKWTFKINKDLKSVNGEVLEKAVGSRLKVKMTRAED